MPVLSMQASRIKNSHAFNLPTFYLPKEDGTSCSIPNAIEVRCLQTSLHMYFPEQSRG